MAVRHDPIGALLKRVLYLGRTHWVDTGQPVVTGTGWAYSRWANRVRGIGSDAEAWWFRSTKCQVTGPADGLGMPVCARWRWHRGQHDL